MLFNTLSFFVFLAVVLTVYVLLSRRAQNVWLLVCSYVFYAWWDWRFCMLLLVPTVVDYSCARGMGRAGERQGRRKLLLLVSLVTDLGILGFFKYFNFFTESLVDLFNLLGLGADPPTLKILLPIGLSFFTFRTMAYTIDVYRRKIEPEQDILHYALYLAFFPQLIAGPIERPQSLLPQIRRPRRITNRHISEGLTLIVIGLFRKMVIADLVAPHVTRCFGYIDLFGSSALVVGAWLYAVQIYCDFAGYSDIAVGTGRLLGFDLVANFRQPYLSRNVTEFWHRWHISLSTWLRDYLYIPLGGNRRGRGRTYLNLLVTMLLGGLWHGAAWTFVVWGAIHGGCLVAHKWFLSWRSGGRRAEQDDRGRGLLVSAVKVLLTFNVVSVAWVFFRAGSLRVAWDYLSAIAAMRGPLLDVANPGKVLEPLTALVFSLAVLSIIDLPQYRRDDQTAVLKWHWAGRGVVIALMIIGIMICGGGDDTPFIYFRF